MKFNALPMYALAVAGLAAAPSALACQECGSSFSSNNYVCYQTGSVGSAACWAGGNSSGTICYATGDCGYGGGGGYGYGYGYGGGGPFFCGSNGCLS